MRIPDRQTTRLWLDIMLETLSVPMAFTEAFLRRYLSIERIEKTREGGIKLVPKVGATQAEVARDADEIHAVIDPTAVYNPSVRSRNEFLVEASPSVLEDSFEMLETMSTQELLAFVKDLEAKQANAKTQGQAHMAEHYEKRLGKIREVLKAFKEN